MELKDIIYRRKSVRSYTGNPVDDVTINKIENYIMELKPLYPDIKVQAKIVEKEYVKCIFPWVTPQVVSIYSEKKEGYLENVGFIFQQLDLYLQSIGLGVCWLGMGRMSNNAVKELEANNLEFVMMLAFGHPKGVALRGNAGEFKRRKLSDISDITDERLEPARLAPSSVNSQPWYFVHEGDVIHAYCTTHGLFKSKTLGEMNQIDMGISMAHMYISNPDTFSFFKADAMPLKGYGYIGSFKI